MYIHINCDLENTNWTIHINIFTVYILVPLRIQVMISISLSVRTGGFQVGNPNPFRSGIRILIQKQGLCFFFPLRKCTSCRFSPWLLPLRGWWWWCDRWSGQCHCAFGSGSYKPVLRDDLIMCDGNLRPRELTGMKCMEFLVILRLRHHKVSANVQFNIRGCTKQLLEIMTEFNWKNPRVSGFIQPGNLTGKYKTKACGTGLGSLFGSQMIPYPKTESSANCVRYLVTTGEVDWTICEAEFEFLRL